MFSRETASNATRSEAGSSSGAPSRRGNRQTGSSSNKTGFLKKFLPGQWKSRSNQGDAELSNETWEQLGSLPEGMREEAYRRLANQRGKKFRIFYDDTAADEEASPSDPDIRAALERSARSASGRAASSAGRVASAGTSTPAPNIDPAVHAFFRTGALDFSHRIAPGFYACFGEFPEVADKGELPALPLLRKCVVLEGREVITVDPGADQGLRTFLDVKIIEAISNEGSMDTTWRLGMVAALVAARLGGAAPDLALAARYSQYSNSMQIGQQSAVLPLGMLTVGMSRHRAILAKLALAWVGISSAIKPGPGDGKVLLFQDGDSVFLVNLTDRPGELTVYNQGGPPSHSSHQTPPASPRASPHTLQETSSFESRHVSSGGGGLAHARGSSSTSLAKLAASSGGVPGAIRGSSASSNMAGHAVGGGDGVDGLSAEVPAAGESSASGNSGLRNAVMHRTAAGAGAGADSPHGDGGSVPLDPSGRSGGVSGGGGGAATPPRSLSPGPTTFINRMPNPFTAGPGGPAPFMHSPTVIAWPFCKPEICTVAVRLQGHSRVVNAVSHGGRRRGDDKERADLMFLSTGSSGWGGGTGSFFGGEHLPHPLADAPSHPRSPPPPTHPTLPLSTSSFPASASDNVLASTTSVPYGGGGSLAELAPVMAPASFDASTGVGAAHSADALPESVSAPMLRISAAQRAQHGAFLASAFDGSGDMRDVVGPSAIAIQRHSQGSARVSGVYASPPSRPPIAPRASMSPPTGSPRRVTFDHGSEAALERLPSSVRSGAQSPTAPPDLQPDAAVLQLSGLASEEMPWWGGSSRMEGSILVSERSRGSSEQIQHAEHGGSPLSTRPPTPELDGEWAETPTSRTAKFPPIPEAAELPPQAAALASAFGEGSGTASSSGDDWRSAMCVDVGPPVASGLATAFSGGSSEDGTAEIAAPSRPPSRAAMLASPFGDSDSAEEETGAAGGFVGADSVGPRDEAAGGGGTAAVLASPFGDDSSGDEGGGGMWGGGGGATAAALGSPFEDEDTGREERHAGAGRDAAPRTESGAAPWRKEASVRMGVVPSLMSPFGGDGDDDDEDDGPEWARGDWDTTTSTDSAGRGACLPAQNGRGAAGAPPSARKGGRPRTASGHRQTYPFSRPPVAKVNYSSSTDEEIGMEFGPYPSEAGGGTTALQVASAGAGGSGEAGEGDAQASPGGGAEMSGAFSLDYPSAVLPTAETHLRALVANKSVHTMEAQFRMWINTSDITMTDEVIGRGSYGQVMLAKFRTERCAVKQIICETKAEYRAAMQEMLLMQELQFDKIVRFFGAIKRGRGVLWMCMEYMPYSDLRKVLHSGGHRRECRFPASMLTLTRRLKWAKDVVAALDLLHSRAVVHRDLKPGNVLISNKGDAVLSDFGLSRVREAQQSRLQASGPGTVSYAAPEALLNNHVSPASDMFSFGCVLWELLSMKEPWTELGGATFQIMSKIVHDKTSLQVNDIPEEIRGQVPEVIEALRQCFSFDPSTRPTAVHVHEVLDDAIENM